MGARCATPAQGGSIGRRPCNVDGDIVRTQSDVVLDDLACMLGCTRTSLHVVASEKGIVVGRLRFRRGQARGRCAC